MNDESVVFIAETPESIAAGKAELAADQKIDAERKTAKAALLNKLGITSDEAKLLLS